MSNEEGKLCNNCSYPITIGSNYCNNCGVAQSMYPSQERKVEHPTKSPFAEPYIETAYLKGGYEDEPTSYPLYYFNLDNLLKGSGNLIRNNLGEAARIYLVFMLLVGIAAIHLTRLSIGIVSPYIENLILDEMTELDETQLLEIWSYLYYVLVLTIANVIVNLTRWIPDVIFYRRIHLQENTLEENFLHTIVSSIPVLLRYLGVTIIIQLIRGVTILFMLSPVIIYIVTGEPISSIILLTFLTIITGGILYFYIDLKLYVVYPRIAMLNESGIEAIIGSWRVTSNNLVRILVINIGLSVAISILQSLISRLIIPFAFFFSEIHAFILTSVIGLSISLPAQPLIRSTVLYFTQLYHGEKQRSPNFRLRSSYYL